MLLRPSNFNYNSLHNTRSLNNNNVTDNLTYGHHGALLLQPLLLTSNSLFRLNLFLNNASRSSDNTSRNLWLNAFPHLPLTNNVAGSRMGKGKGNLNDWYSNLSYGNVLLEYNNLSRGRSVYFLSQLNYSLPANINMVETTRMVRYSQLPLNVSINVSVSDFS